jgi:hypothetical protein
MEKLKRRFPDWRAAFRLSGIYARFATLRDFRVTATGMGLPALNNFGGPSDHDPKTIVILDNVASDEHALKSLTDDACVEFRKYGLPPPSVPRPLANYVPCRVLIQTYKDPGGRRRGRIQFIRPTGVLRYDEEWMI